MAHLQHVLITGYSVDEKRLTILRSVWKFVNVF